MKSTVEQLRNLASVEIVLLIILGLGVGYYAKGLAHNRVTIGYNDPGIRTEGDIYDIDRLEQELIASGIPQAMPVDTTVEVVETSATQ